MVCFQRGGGFALASAQISEEAARCSERSKSGAISLRRQVCIFLSVEFVIIMVSTLSFPHRPKGGIIPMQICAPTMPNI